MNHPNNVGVRARTRTRIGGEAAADDDEEEEEEGVPGQNNENNDDEEQEEEEDEDVSTHLRISIQESLQGDFLLIHGRSELSEAQASGVDGEMLAAHVTLVPWSSRARQSSVLR